ncbi:hypothetical protein HDU93_009212 [Gonapodya sp. JEL0774]|nr:hypothetical protein HDU93_009212 [Gonapodya sp. JEL0774]
MKHFAYRCIAELTFLFPRIVTHPVYRSVLNARAASTCVLPFLDLGTCFGNDLRKLAVDGYPKKELVGLDVDKTFWDCGLKLYDGGLGEDGHFTDTSGIAFMLGDILDNAFLASEDMNGSTVAPDKEHLPFPISRSYSPETINHLNAHFQFIHAGSLLHLFTESTIPVLLRKTFSLLRPGGLFFGRTVGITGDLKGGIDVRKDGVYGAESQLGYLHTRWSLSRILEDVGFVDIRVEEMSGRRGVKPSNEKTFETDDSGVTLRFMLFSGRRPGGEPCAFEWITSSS